MNGKCVAAPSCPSPEVILANPQYTAAAKKCAVCLTRKCCAPFAACNAVKCVAGSGSPEDKAVDACLAMFCSVDCA
jgi:hypothetical protein